MLSKDDFPETRWRWCKFRNSELMKTFEWLIEVRAEWWQFIVVSWCPVRMLYTCQNFDAVERRFRLVYFYKLGGEEKKYEKITENIPLCPQRTFPALFVHHYAIKLGYETVIHIYKSIIGSNLDWLMLVIWSNFNNFAWNLHHLDFSSV